MTTLRRLMITVLVLAASISGAGSASAASDGPSSIPALDSTYFIPATGQTMSSAALEYWTTHDGATLLGMPMTSADKHGRQIFQFGAITIRKSGKVVAASAGSELVALKYGPVRAGNNRRPGLTTPTRAFKSLAAAPNGSSVVFDETTGHSVKGGFARTYGDLGGAEALGHPLSEAYQFGATRIQWFERGELIDDGDSVHLAPIGVELAVRSGIKPDSPDTNHRWVYLDRYKATAGDGTLADDPAVFAPVGIQIPAIGVDANIEDVPIVDGVMQTPQDVWSVGWYYDLPAPGQYTNVVMAAHKDWWGVGPVVFYNLGSLVNGDMIYLWDADGNGATYQVTSVQVVNAEINAGDVISDKNADTLTLITCGGDFDGEHYLSRVIVESVRV